MTRFQKGANDGIVIDFSKLAQQGAHTLLRHKNEWVIGLCPMFARRHQNAMGKARKNEGRQLLELDTTQRALR
jgi:hypothetical protein